MGAQRTRINRGIAVTIAFLFGIAVFIIWSGCQYDPYYYSYLRSEPPAEEICGIWVVDTERTTWRKAKAFLQAGLLDPKHGCLELESNGLFKLEGLPNFWSAAQRVIVPENSGSGRWTLEQDQNGIWYVDLSIEEVNDKAVKHEGDMVLFRREGLDYFLHITIIDPDSGEALVMKRREG